MKALLINKNDLKHNINVIKEQAKKTETKVIAVVKGNGYGLGLVEYSKFLIDNGIEMLAVATTEDAVKLREAGIKEDILMMSSTCIKEDVKKLIEDNIILTIGSKESLQIAEELARKFNVNVRAHLKIDTGFGRYGFVYSQLEEIVKLFEDVTNIKIEGTFSHFSQSYAKNEKWTNIQFDRFIAATAYLQNHNLNTGMLHICNSSAFIRYPNMHLNAVRIGSAFLGRIVVENVFGLKRIGVFRTQISEIKMLPKGYNIGYSNTFKTKRNTKIAIVPVGYFDGYNVKNYPDVYRFIDKIRYLYNDIKNLFKDKKLKVVIGNKKYRLVGKIGMYHMAIDITKSENIKTNDIIDLDINPLYVDSNIRREYI